MKKGECKDTRIIKDEHEKRDEHKITRATTTTKKDNSSILNKRYFVTCAIAGASLDEDFFSSVLTYCKRTNAELIILPMRGVRKTDVYFCSELLKYSSSIFEEFVFNSKLVAQDFLINPQMINPLTGLSRYGLGNHSLIIASPKQFMITTPTGTDTIPNIIHSTGSITIPQYAQTRQGKLAEQDHCRGGLIVEVKDNSKFYIRQAVGDNGGGFYDLGVYYHKNNVEQQRASAFIMGDYHCGFQDETVVQNWIECIEKTNPKYIVFHDFFDGHSINYHHNNDIERQINRKEELNTLEKELDYMAKQLIRWNTLFPTKELVIVYSNHFDFLKKYLTRVEYKEDRLNHKIALKLALWLLDGHNPIQKYIESNYNVKNVKWLKEEKDYKLHDVRIGHHGHKPKSIRGSIIKLESVYGNSIIAHGHSPRIFRNLMVVGTSTPIYLDYTTGSPTNWMNSSALLYRNGKKQLINSIKGEWRLHT